ncbi:TIGR03619 family F420-dependent LLM class oxidoreductase [Nonomuraea gerenzanensis]|uniref:Luciferase-like protein n=1 Tax=Nonomuraea gerenzanensis TaxID=93944 RepID=A0A1M4E870_9ACTN|nr:TIGR03619 family F420-dependent LLM class oxidoreductase [Nonomuraea gerenzanensis]UBU17183.1 TIGR03619 family F420-dependent LLM class oxidoreductase [Nonomuraea gerenzanensis]SBO94923.1 luciferase-like protein [Nonomuraea gerenzanensis]
MRVGFAVPVSGPWATPENLRRIAVRAEELGYHELWTFQRLLYPVGHPMGATYRAVHDPLITLAHVSAVTSRIRLGVAVINAYVQPVPLAKQLATLQTLSGGRVSAGIGLGWLPEEFEATGVDMARRGRRGEEFVEVLRKAWTDDVVEHDGEFYRVPPAHIDPKPLPGPPQLLLGGTAEVALRRAARLADGWVSSSREDLASIAARIGLIKDELAAAGRDASTFRLVCRGSTQVRAHDEERPLTGTYDKIRRDVQALADRGVTEVFHDLNFDREIPQSDAKEAMRRAEEALEALAP